MYPFGFFVLFYGEWWKRHGECCSTIISCEFQNLAKTDFIYNLLAVGMCAVVYSSRFVLFYFILFYFSLFYFILYFIFYYFLLFIFLYFSLFYSILFGFV